MKQIENWKLKIENSNRGFTLVELLLYAGLLTVLLGVLSSIFATTVDLQLESKAVSSVEQDSRFILARLSYDIKRADSIITPSTIGQSNTSLQLVIDGINYSYELNGDNLELTSTTTGTDQINSYDTKISNLDFTRLGNTGGKNSIKISLRITSQVQKKSGFEIKDINTTLGSR